MAVPNGFECWRHQSGEVGVVEVEHLFGFDLICYRTMDGYQVPVGIITRHQRLLEWERKFAREWADATALDDYARAVMAMRTLQGG